MKKIGIVLIVVGVVALILACSLFTAEVGLGEGYEQYGGDAYTGIQNAAARTSKNVVITNEILCLGFGSVLLVMSFLGLGVGVALLIPNKIKKEKKETVAAEKEKVATDTTIPE